MVGRRRVTFDAVALANRAVVKVDPQPLRWPVARLATRSILAGVGVIGGMAGITGCVCTLVIAGCVARLTGQIGVPIEQGEKGMGHTRASQIGKSYSLPLGKLSFHRGCQQGDDPAGIAWLCVNS